MNFSELKIDYDKVGFFRFKKLNNSYLLTNDLSYVRLNEQDFLNFLEGKLSEESKLFKNLKERGFIKNSVNIEQCAKKYCERNHFLMHRGVTLHIVVVTKRCNQLCVYCQAGREELQKDFYDMTKETAQKTVDIIFQTPADAMTIEFQGGEPLLNWEVVKFINEYAKEKNKTYKKALNFSLVTNLTLMTEERYQYLIENEINICTSLDGPEHVHNKNRPFKGGNSYEAVISWTKRMRENEKNNNLRRRLSALVTLTKYSLENIKEVIDEYIKYGFKVIHLRQLSFLGFSAKEYSNDEFSYNAEEFIEAWKEGLDYIIEKNLQGIELSERGVSIMLSKILKERDPSFLDLRSPCGAGIGQLAYFYNGDVYCCDEGRMIEEDLFLLGNVYKDNYEEILSNSKVKTLVTASTLDNFACDECAYKSYCGICPVLNYILYGNLFPDIRTTDKCKIHEAMLDYIFEKMEDPEVLKIFKKWIGIKV